MNIFLTELFWIINSRGDENDEKPENQIVLTSKKILLKYKKKNLSMDCSSWAGWTTSHGFDHSGARITRQDQIYNWLSCNHMAVYPIVYSTKLLCNTAFAREFSTVCLCSHSRSWSNSSANFRRFFFKKNVCRFSISLETRHAEIRSDTGPATCPEGPICDHCLGLEGLDYS